MVSGGRVICVAFPFVLALISVITLLVAGLTGVTNKSMYMFEVNTTGLSVSESDLLSMLSRRSVGDRATTTTTTSSSSNVTASHLGIGKLYDVNVWNYCETSQSGKRNCSKAAFNWAASAVNASEASLETQATSTGESLELPKTVKKALSAFVKLSHWTQIVFVIALVSLAVEIVVGLFTSCSRAIACLTYLVASFAVVAVTATAGLATATGVVVVAVVDADLKKYGVTAKLSGHYLAVVWIAAAAAIAASFFWMLSICCCKPESRRLRGAAAASRGPAAPFNDKNAPVGSYQPLNDPNQAGYYNSSYAPQYGAQRQPAAGGRSDVAYEPYSHARV